MFQQLAAEALETGDAEAALRYARLDFEGRPSQDVHFLIQCLILSGYHEEAWDLLERSFLQQGKRTDWNPIKKAYNPMLRTELELKSDSFYMNYSPRLRENARSWDVFVKRKLSVFESVYEWYDSCLEYRALRDKGAADRESLRVVWGVLTPDEQMKIVKSRDDRSVVQTILVEGWSRAFPDKFPHFASGLWKEEVLEVANSARATIMDNVAIIGKLWILAAVSSDLGEESLEAKRRLRQLELYRRYPAFREAWEILYGH
jgi:hypothetical protein